MVQTRTLSIQYVLIGAVMLVATTSPLAKEKEKAKGPTIYTYTGRQYRNPTLNPLLPSSSQESKSPEVVNLPAVAIQGIVWGPSPKAIINNHVVSKGDILSQGIEVLEISKGSVKVLYREKIFTLLPKGVIEEK